MASLKHNFSPVQTEDFGVVCFARGTLIETEIGAVPVENLKVGISVRTKDNGYQPIRWIGSKKLSAVDFLIYPQLRPIRIRNGSLGNNTPSEDLLVSPQHRILASSRIVQRMFGSDEVLVAAKQILRLNGVEIAKDIDGIEYFHFLLDQHEIVTANGAEAESLYTGPEALKLVEPEALEEIFSLFPELRNGNPAEQPASARPLASGRMARKLTARHLQNNKPLVTVE
ncbi:hemolysin [Paracoccus methylarcula]|uniref:Hemolysin n=2 Tax=Paracoccus methylarcula TaxID=72022 RepID=A0A422QS40_9RHOB|nr:hemolysin [Paracoccus methylarcula]